MGLGNRANWTLRAGCAVQEFRKDASEVFMKILVLNALSGLYLERSAKWTDVASEAREFPQASEAVAFCNKNQFVDLHLRWSQICVLRRPISAGARPFLE